MAMTDDLTGLHNLRSFEVELTAMMRSARSSGATVWMLVLDLDRLKSLNDTYGHLTGAEAVRHVGHVLATQLPADAVACRYGGDEFAVCVMGRTEAEVRVMAKRLCRGVHGSAPVLAGRAFQAGTLSISVGIAAHEWPGTAAANMTDPDVTAGESLFRSADEALYGAKSRGRNQVFVARVAAPDYSAVTACLALRARQEISAPSLGVEPADRAKPMLRHAARRRDDLHPVDDKAGLVLLDQVDGDRPRGMARRRDSLTGGMPHPDTQLWMTLFGLSNAHAP